MSYFKTDEEAFNQFNYYLNDQELSHKQLTPDIVFGWIREQNHIPFINTSLNQRLLNEMQITAHEFYVASLHWYYKSKHFHLEKDTANMLVQTDVP